MQRPLPRVRSIVGFGVVENVSTIGRRVEEALKRRVGGEGIPLEMGPFTHLRALTAQRELAPDFALGEQATGKSGD